VVTSSPDLTQTLAFGKELNSLGYYAAKIKRGLNMAFQLAPFLASAGLSIGQGIMADRAAKREQERMEQEAAQAKLINSFGGNAQPTPSGPQAPSMAQQVMSDPLTQQLLAGLIGKGLSGFGGGQGGGGQMPSMQQDPFYNMTR